MRRKFKVKLNVINKAYEDFVKETKGSYSYSAFLDHLGNPCSRPILFKIKRGEEVDISVINKLSYSLGILPKDIIK